MASAPEITPEEMETYRDGARRRREAERRALAEREARAWEAARRAANELRRRFGVSRVVVFGSLTHPGCFTPWSDIDIAAWGINPDDTFRAIGVAMDVDDEIPVNLVDVGACRPSLRRVIAEEGVPI